MILFLFSALRIYLYNIYVSFIQTEIYKARPTNKYIIRCLFSLFVFISIDISFIQTETYKVRSFTQHMTFILHTNSHITYRYVCVNSFPLPITSAVSPLSLSFGHIICACAYNSRKLYVKMYLYIHMYVFLFNMILLLCNSMVFILVNYSFFFFYLFLFSLFSIDTDTFKVLGVYIYIYYFQISFITVSTVELMVLSAQYIN